MDGACVMYGRCVDIHNVLVQLPQLALVCEVRALLARWYQDRVVAHSTTPCWFTHSITGAVKDVGLSILSTT